MTRKPSQPSDKQPPHTAERPPRGGISSKASRPSPKTTTAKRGADGSAPSQHQQPSNAQENRDNGQGVQHSGIAGGIAKEDNAKGELSLQDQALSALRSVLNDPGSSPAARNDAAAKILQALKGTDDKPKAINGLTRDELRSEIVRVRAMLG